ncbi:MAG: GNAT family N-acetyltransferase [Ferruginibacter sp.]
MQLKTARLHLNPIQKTDAHFIMELVNSPGWLQYIGDRQVLSIADAEKYIEKIFSYQAITYLVVYLTAENKPIGIISFMQRTNLDHPDIGFAFLPQYHHKGYAFEATDYFIRTLKKEKKYNRLEAITIPENQSSIRLLTKLGLKFDRIIEDENESLQLFSMTL